jgi:hypothetical protein
LPLCGLPLPERAIPASKPSSSLHCIYENELYGYSRSLQSMFSNSYDTICSLSAAVHKYKILVLVITYLTDTTLNLAGKCSIEIIITSLSLADYQVL